MSTNKNTSTNKHARREVRHATDLDGKAIVLVSLANHDRPAKLLAEDFAAIVEAGYTDQWTFNSNGIRHAYVRCYAATRGRLATVARLIVAPRKGYRVRYIDGDRLNLRGDNLQQVRGARPKKYRDEEVIDAL